MNYQELKSRIDSASTNDDQKATYKKLLAHSGVGGKVWPYYKPHLDNASTVDSFFEGIYLDDDLKLTEIWALWAKLKHPEEWVSRFQPQIVLDRIIGKKNLIITGDKTRAFYPQKGIADSFIVMVLNDGEFNRTLCEYVGAVDGDFKIEGYRFSGTYDIFRDENLFILLKWQFDGETGWRLKPAHRNVRNKH